MAFLLATDVAARGLDILGVETVVNFDCPTQLASYLHRCSGCVQSCSAWKGAVCCLACMGAADNCSVWAGCRYRCMPPHEAAGMTSATAALRCCSCRVGRTARAGAKGRALTFIEDDDRQLLKEVRQCCWFGPLSTRSSLQ